jgi:hypothetical protein
MCWVDEFCSSKCCSACGADTVDAIFAKKAAIRRTGKRKGRLRRTPPPSSPSARRHRKACPATLMSSLCRFPKKSARLVPSLADVVFPVLDRTRQLIVPPDKDDPGDKPSVCLFLSPPLATSVPPHVAPADSLLPVGSCVNMWGVRACVSPQCRNRVWDRDINACCNMALRVAWWLLYKLAGPPHLCARSADRIAATEQLTLLLLQQKPRRA